MTIAEAKAIYQELQGRYESRLAEAGLLCEFDIYLEDEEFERTDYEFKAVSIEIDVIIFTESISKDDAYGCCTMADINNGYVSESALKESALEFEEALNTFIDEVVSSGDAEGTIKRENEKDEKEVEEMMLEFTRKMKNSNTAALIAVGVCAVAAVVAILMHFLL